MIGRLSKSTLDKALVQDADYFIWDADLKGFGVKVARGGRKSFVCKYRVGGGRSAPTRRMTIGAYGSPWTVDQARQEARRILGKAVNGEDPAAIRLEARNRITVAELCALYLERGVGTKKASTLATDRGRIERHIKPLLGRKKVSDVTRADIKRFLQDVAEGKTEADVKTGKRGRAIVRGGKGTASRTVGLLGGIFSFAIDSGLTDENPVKGVKRYPDKKGQRFLRESELQALGLAIQTAEESGLNPAALAIIKLLIFTGARKGEIEQLKWSEVDLAGGYLRLDDSKTGQKIIPLNGAAAKVLAEIPRMDGSRYVFPAHRDNGFYQGTPKVWKVVRQNAGLDDVRLHDIRHSFASIAVSGGASLPVVGALLGHSNSATTQQYAHLLDDPLKLVTEAVGNVLEKSFSGTRDRNSHSPGD